MVTQIRQRDPVEQGGSARRSMSRAVRALGEQRGSRAPAAVDLSRIGFALVLQGAGEEYAPRPVRRTGALSGSHLEQVPRVGPWAAHGACRNQTDLFFPVRGQRPHAAIALCGSCPSLEPCRAYGLSNPAQLGVLGALTVEERRRVRAEMRAATKVTRGTEEHPLFAVLEELARYPVMTWGEIGRGVDCDAVVQLAFELGANWRPLPPGRWEFDVEQQSDGAVLRARLRQRDLSVLSRPAGWAAVDPDDPDDSYDLDDSYDPDDLGAPSGAVAPSDLAPSGAVGHRPGHDAGHGAGHGAGHDAGHAPDPAPTGRPTSRQAQVGAATG